MYLLRTREVIHVLALSVAFSMIFAMYCGNIIDEKISNIIDSVQYLFTPQINYYGNYNPPYFY